MSVQVYGCNHIAIEVDNVKKAIAFYRDVFNLEKLDQGEGDAFFKLGQHQFLAIFKVKKPRRDRMRHFGIIVRDEAQVAEVHKKLTGKYGIKLIPDFDAISGTPLAIESRSSISTTNRSSGCCPTPKSRSSGCDSRTRRSALPALLPARPVVGRFCETAPSGRRLNRRAFQRACV